VSTITARLSDLSESVDRFVAGDDRYRTHIEELTDEIRATCLSMQGPGIEIDPTLLIDAIAQCDAANTVLAGGAPMVEGGGGSSGAAAAASAHSGGRRAGVAASAVLGAPGEAIPVLRESGKGSQIAKPVRFLGTESETNSKEVKRVKLSLLNTRYDMRLPVKGEGDCLLRSTMLGLLLTNKLDVIEGFMTRYRDSAAFKGLSANGEYEAVAITPDSIDEFIKMIQDVKSGALPLHEIFFLSEHPFDTAFCNIMRSAIAQKIEEAGFVDGGFAALVPEWSEQATTRKGYLGDVHGRALATLLDIRIARVMVDEMKPYEGIADGVDGAFGVFVDVLGASDKEEEDVTLYYEGDGHNHYDVLLSSDDKTGIDVVRLSLVMTQIKDALGGADLEYDRAKDLLQQAYAFVPVTRETLADPVVKAGMLRFRRIIDSMKARIETRLNCSIVDIEELDPKYAVKVICPELPADSVDRKHVIPLGELVEVEESLFALRVLKNKDAADMFLHHLNVYFSHDVRAEVYERYSGAMEPIDVGGLLHDTIETIVSYDGEKGDKMGTLLGNIYRLLGESDREEGYAFGRNHLFESPYFFAKALSSK